MARALAMLALAAACGSSAMPTIVDAPPPPRDAFAGDCELTVYGATPDGQCIAQWVCVSVGTRTLSCGALSAGVGCLCTADDGTTTSVSTLPASCTDPMVLTQFATTSCGWGGL